MEQKNKPDLVGKWLKIAPKFFIVAIAFCVLFLLIAWAIYPDEVDATTSSECEIFEATWFRIMENGERVPVEVPSRVEAQRGEPVVFTTVLPTDLINGDNLCFRPIWQEVQIYIDGELRLDYNTEKTRPFGTNSPFRYLFVELTEEDAGKEMLYVFTSDSKYAGLIRPIYFGDHASIWFTLIADGGAKAVAALCLGLMGLFCLLVCAALRYAYRKPFELRHLSWAIFLCALWMLSEIEFRQLVVSNISIWTNITYWCLMLIAFPLLSYMNEIQKYRYRVAYALNIAYAGIVFVVGTILQMLDISQFVSQLPFIHFGVAVAIATVIITITIDTVKKRLKEYMLVGVGVYGMLLSAALEMALYYMDAGVSIGAVLAIGLMFLLIMAIIKTGNDIIYSEKKKQEAITAREAQAKFLANMSHEIRTPINAVIGMNEMILRENMDETIRDYAQNIQRASSMLLELVNDILDFSKIEAGQLELVESEYYLGNVLHDEKLLLDARIGNRPIDIVMDVDPHLPVKLYGDEVRIKQILTNLLSNAAKYTEKGSITIKVFFEWITKDMISLCVKISDTGVGIKEEDVGVLFDEFRRLEVDKNRNVEGTGLGLNIVKRLVKLMDGDIAVDSEYGKGSTFTVRIPQKVTNKDELGSYEQVTLKPDDKMLTHARFTAPEASVLVVDDNVMNLTLMKALLKRTQINVDTARSGRECLKFTKQKKYDLILMDHMMPEMDGIETLYKIRRDETNDNKDITVIALTANAVAGCREMYLGYGFDDYFSKPIQAAKLEELLMEYLPKGLVCVEGEKCQKEESEVGPEGSQELLAIDRTLGLSYCMNAEDVYQEMLCEFCKQMEDYLPELERCIKDEDWKNYAIVAHAIKSNAISIGAVNFAEMSKCHEMAAKESGVEYITTEYAAYVSAIKELTEYIKSTNDATGK